NRAATIRAVEATEEEVFSRRIRSAGGVIGPLAAVLYPVGVNHVLGPVRDVGGPPPTPRLAPRRPRRPEKKSEPGLLEGSLLSRVSDGAGADSHRVSLIYQSGAWQTGGPRRTLAGHLSRAQRRPAKDRLSANDGRRTHRL